MKHVVSFSAQLLEALKHIHSMGYIHADFKVQ
jgi:hypothetical protein